MKNKKSKRKGFKLRNIILLVLILYIGKTFLGQGILMKDLKNRKLNEEQEISQLKEEIRELQEEIKTKDSLDFVEKVAREDLGMVKPREIVYIDKNKAKDRNHFMNFRK
ncbi:MAG: septum formation initiator family protein [Tissierellia bacterium]|nr:septum formation initiator family protein [Tissierellia bacterium]